MTEVRYTIRNKTGLHARPASEFVKLANTFKSSITVEKEDGKSVDGKSILSILTLGAGPESNIIIRADGSDSEQAVGELVKLLDRTEE